MTDIFSEQQLSLAELAREENVNISTIWRWCLRGCRGVTLESFSVGGRRYTSRQASRRFKVACTAAAGASTPSPFATPRQRDAAARGAAAKLAAAGF